MEVITLSPLFHRGKERIGIFSASDPGLNKIYKKSGARFSRTHGCWYVSLSRENYEVLLKNISGRGVLISDDLKKYLENKKAPPGDQINNLSIPEKIIQKPTAYSFSPQVSPILMCKENQEALQQFRQQLVLKSYSASTLRTYTNEFSQFLQTVNQVPASSFTTDRVRDYLQYCHEKLKLSENTLHSRINALKFYFEQVLHREKFFWEIPRPKKRDQLPKVLSETEIGRLFNSITNIKHKAILFTAYSAGLRVSEVVNLKIRDVDSSRMLLLIENSKGKKDRYVGLGIMLLDVLRSYISGCRPRPKKYVFENPLQPGEPYSIRSAQKIFQLAKEKAFINKDVGIHSLRHSFATHLLEKGIDIRYIKDLLGHFSIKTTERYLHVKKESLINIPNLLDELNKTLTLEW
jgi:site-specific recombinase XerD